MNLNKIWSDHIRAITPAILLMCVFNIATGQEEKTSHWYESISVNAFASTAYSYNFNRPDTLKDFYRVFDFDDASMKIDILELSVKKDALKPDDAGFRFDLAAGSSVPRIARSAGFNTGDLDFHQMFLSYVAPLGSGLKLDIGKFITSAGYEVIEGYDGYNDNYSRSLLFGYAIPFTHTGVRASYTFSDHASAVLMLVNGWDNSVDSNASKSISAQVSITPARGLALTATCIYGAEKPRNNSDYRSLYDFVGTYAVSDFVTLGANGDFGTEQHSAAGNGSGVWLGLAGYLRFNLQHDFSLCLRAEQFEDKDGIRTMTPQILRDVTVTPEYRLSKHVVMRADLRCDKSDMNVFQKASGWTDTQLTTGVNVLYIL
jgi:hypothetical protein